MSFVVIATFAVPERPELVLLARISGFTSSGEAEFFIDTLDGAQIDTRYPEQIAIYRKSERLLTLDDRDVHLHILNHAEHGFYPSRLPLHFWLRVFASPQRWHLTEASAEYELPKWYSELEWGWACTTSPEDVDE
ncbi:hypothetical protein [Rhodocyclus gracilis]|uniref:Uncharacterized protein n=1 Tax=Rhodocyclus tenuis TaxID=1066 RepID=A0A6L5JXD4_RHOTE|nr:hypothetical protein [Rhodocyclus gracilis]MQY51294.1 hypothetical protein [Rhodocyclus gracilis]